MIKRVLLYTQTKGGDGRYRPDSAYGAIDVDRIVYMERVESWHTATETYPVTCVHFDDGSSVDVLLSIDKIMDLMAPVEGE